MWTEKKRNRNRKLVTFLSLSFSICNHQEASNAGTVPWIRPCPLPSPSSPLLYPGLSKTCLKAINKIQFNKIFKFPWRMLTYLSKKNQSLKQISCLQVGLKKLEENHGILQTDLVKRIKKTETKFKEMHKDLHNR